MQEVLALTLHAMQQDMQRLDRVASNLANATTIGYQRDLMARQAIAPSGLSFAGLVDAQRVVGRPLEGVVDQSNAIVRSLQVHRDARPGSLKYTGQSLDVALAGPGYFEVTTPSGPAYTRQGNFQLDASGRLVTASGFPVMGKGGEIFLNDIVPSIDVAGRIMEGSVQPRGRSPEGVLAQLKVVRPDNEVSLQRLGNGLLTSSGSLTELQEVEVQIRQGYTENSNVNSMHEMVQLVETMRHFESMQKVALGYDEMTAQAVRKLGDLS